MEAISHVELKMERFSSGTQFGSRYLKKISRSVCSFIVVMLACMQKQYVPEFPVFPALQEFPVFPALKLPSCKLVALLDTKHS